MTASKLPPESPKEIANTVDELMERVKDLTSNGEKDFYKGYNEIFRVLKTKPQILGMDRDTDTYDQTLTWFERAAEINSNDPKSSANKFIRALSKYGLKISGQNLLNDKNQDRLFDTTTDIGKHVIGYILENNTVPGIGEIINAEIKGALSKGGQDLAGWGGAFYYWDHTFDDGETIGQKIMASPESLEKFIAINAAAARFTIGSEISEGDVYEVGESLWFNWKSPVPSLIKKEIKARVILGNFIGDPNHVDGWRYNSNKQKWYMPIPPLPEIKTYTDSNKNRIPPESKLESSYPSHVVYASKEESDELNKTREIRSIYLERNFSKLEVFPDSEPIFGTDLLSETQKENTESSYFKPIDQRVHFVKEPEEIFVSDEDIQKRISEDAYQKRKLLNSNDVRAEDFDDDIEKKTNPPSFLNDYAHNALLHPQVR